MHRRLGWIFPQFRRNVGSVRRIWCWTFRSRGAGDARHLQQAIAQRQDQAATGRLCRAVLCCDTARYSRDNGQPSQSSGHRRFAFSTSTTGKLYQNFIAKQYFIVIFSKSEGGPNE